VFVANRPIPGIGKFAADSGSPQAVSMELCGAEEGAADDRIVSLAASGDIVVTRDVPLAARLVERGITVLDDRGGLYSTNNIAERLSERNFRIGLAESGAGGPRNAEYDKAALKAFADSFDRLIQKKFYRKVESPTSWRVKKGREK
jgi:uncharacterized protein YaiI (UPF0178 family)